MKVKRAKLGGSRWNSLQNLVFAAIIGGLMFLGLAALTRRVADPAAIRIQTPERRELSTKVEDMRLMLASHGRLMWYFPGNESTKVLHEGQVGAISSFDLCCSSFLALAQSINLERFCLLGNVICSFYWLLMRVYFSLLCWYCLGRALWNISWKGFFLWHSGKCVGCATASQLAPQDDRGSIIRASCRNRCVQI